MTISSSRRAAGLHLLLGLILLAILGWRIAAWTASGWSGMAFGPPTQPRLTYSIRPRIMPGEVFRLAAESPASRAGLTKGDRIEAVNGIAVTDARVERIAARAGQRLHYQIREKGQRSLQLETPFRNLSVVKNL